MEEPDRDSLANQTLSPTAASCTRDALDKAFLNTIASIRKDGGRRKKAEKVLKELIDCTEAKFESLKHAPKNVSNVEPHSAAADIRINELEFEVMHMEKHIASYKMSKASIEEEAALDALSQFDNNFLLEKRPQKTFLNLPSYPQKK